MQKILKDHSLTLLLFGIFTAVIFMRPALPVDETRYLTVAWEMWFKKDWVHLSYNFDPYSHKPPLLFWLMNMFWHVFGISRWAATMPSILSSVAVVVLTEKLAAKLFPEKDLPKRARLLMLGSLPFLIYGSMIMFDMMITAWTLAALLFFLNYAEKRNFALLLGYGLCMGMGVLTKGPVIYIYTLLPALLAPWWMKKEEGNASLVAFTLLALLISVVPVLLWLVPALETADHTFAYWVLWEQTAGRVTGGFSAAHNRPFYFYLPLVPVLFLPWILFPSFWRGARALKKNWIKNFGLRFLAFWILPGFLAFSLISGKQPHYLVPFLPGLIILTAYFMKDASNLFLRKVVLSLFAVFVIGHAVAAKTFFELYDWRPIADYVHVHQDVPWAYVTNYNGEIGFLARMEHPLTSTNLKTLPAWFRQHPRGLAIIRYKDPAEVKQYEPLLVIPYRMNHYAGIFKKRRF